MSNRIAESNYYGIPKNMDFDGALPTGQLCQTHTRQGLPNPSKLYSFDYPLLKHSNYFLFLTRGWPLHLLCFLTTIDCEVEGLLVRIDGTVSNQRIHCFNSNNPQLFIIMTSTLVKTQIILLIYKSFYFWSTEQFTE